MKYLGALVVSNFTPTAGIKLCTILKRSTLFCGGPHELKVYTLHFRQRELYASFTFTLGVYFHQGIGQLVGGPFKLNSDQKVVSSGEPWSPRWYIHAGCSLLVGSPVSLKRAEAFFSLWVNEF